MAEDRGFEPLEACTSTDFKSAAIDHSASPPRRDCDYITISPAWAGECWRVSSPEWRKLPLSFTAVTPTMFFNNKAGQLPLLEGYM